LKDENEAFKLEKIKLV